MAGGPGLDGKFQPGFSHAEEAASPGLYEVRLNPARGAGIDTALTATTRTGMARFEFPANPHASVLIDAGGSAQPDDFAAVSVDPGRREISGTASSGLFCGQRPRYRVYFAAVFDRRFDAYGTWREGVLDRGGEAAEDTQLPAANPRTTAQAGAYASFDTRKNRTVTARVGVSFVSVAGRPRQPRRREPGPWLRRDRAAGPQALEPGAGPDPGQRRPRPPARHLLHGALPRLPGAADLQRRRRRLPGDGRADPPGPRPHPVRRLLRLGHLPHPGAAAGAAGAAAGERHDEVAAGRRRAERLPAPLALRERPEHDHGRRLRRPDPRLGRGFRGRRLRPPGGPGGDGPGRHPALPQRQRRIPPAPGAAELHGARLRPLRPRHQHPQRQLDLRRPRRGLGLGGDHARVRRRRLRDRPAGGALPARSRHLRRPSCAARPTGAGSTTPPAA